MTPASRSERLDGAAGATTSVRVTRDIAYGKAFVGIGSADGARLRPLRLDRYEPAAAALPGQLRPAVVMAFGGAFHRGSKEDDSFEGGAARNTAVADYCRRFAEWGCVACSVDYRLVPEDPDAGSTRVVFEPERIPRSRVDVVRRLMGLEPATHDALWRGIEAASDDLAAAVRFVQAQAGTWGIDAERIVVGGFSAGARSALNVAFAERVPVAAVLSLSGYIDADDLARHLAVPAAAAARPPVLLVHGEHDLDYIVAGTPAIRAGLRAAGVVCCDITVPGGGHFYPASAPARDQRGMVTTLDAAIAAFLHLQIGADCGA